MEHTHEFNVAMSCSGCSGAVQRVLNKMEGVSKIDISLEKQLVVVRGSASEADIMATIKKTGKTVSARGPVMGEGMAQ